MHRFKNIGLVLDLNKTNEFIISQAKDLLETNRATIHVICALTYKLDSEQKKSIERAIIDKANFVSSITFLFGKPLITITKYCDQHKLDLLLIESDDEKKISAFFHGSLALSLMRKAPCPVWVVKAINANVKQQKILIAIDPENTSTDESLNDRLIEIGTSYVKRKNAKGYLVTAWRLEGESALRGPFMDATNEQIEKLKKQRKKACTNALQTTLSRHVEELNQIEVKMLYGEAGYVIAEFVRDNDIDLVIMGTLGRFGVSGFIIGNTAETIISNITCSLIAIKPDGFVSPLLS